MARSTTGSTQASLTKALQPVIRTLVADMRHCLDEDAGLLQSWKTEHAQAQAADRVSISFEEWSEEQLQQAAAGWVLTTVFLRFIEDNDLFGPRQVFLTGFDASRRALGRDYEASLYQDHPDYSYRAYLSHCFEQLAEVPATKDLVGPHAAIHIIAPSDDAARELIEFFRALDGDENTRWMFNDPDLSTRFLGDLYQDLSEFAREKYALLQTPDFVEEFILDRTLTPALGERPLEGFKIIDPTCGSGHFLLGAFHRLVTEWEKHAPALNPAERAERAMEAVHGVDINPFAVAISQFRLTVAYVQAAGDAGLTDRTPKPGFTVLAGDSLLFGPDAEGQGALNLRAENFVYSTENADALDAVLTPGIYDVVVGNPPYITVKDKALSRQYRDRFAKYTKGTYALTVPFMVKFFQLAKDGNTEQTSGWVGQITANSFMTRDFGKPLIEEFFKTVDIREIIDTGIEELPGHGTPTVTIVGRNSRPSHRKILGILGGRQDPDPKTSAGHSKAWKSIVDNIEEIGYSDDHISVVQLSRQFVSHFPWNLQGGSVAETLMQVKNKSDKILKSAVEGAIGGAVRIGADEAFLRPVNYLNRIQDKEELNIIPIDLGEEIRDFQRRQSTLVIYPYEYGTGVLSPGTIPDYLWKYRTILAKRKTFHGNMKDGGLEWFEFMQPTWRTYITDRSISYAEVASHNHFYFEREKVIFKQTAPVIKLRETASDENFFDLVSKLNSSIACFWMRNNCYPKSTDAEKWRSRYAFSGNAISNFPLPAGDLSSRGRRLDTLAQELATYEPAAVFTGATPTREAIDEAEANYVRVRQLMIAEQEELDWAVYHLYGLTDTDISLPAGSVEGIELGTRPFEIALARRVAAGETTTAWFERHHSTPVTEIPDSWPEAQRVAAQQRLELMASDKSIKLLEAPEYKRRWADDLWTDKVHEALGDWLLTRLETPELWRRSDGMAQPRTIRELAAQVETDPDLADALSVLSLWSARRGATAEKMLDDLLKGEAVPYVASLRYKKRGFAKRAEWEATWDAQRREDAGEITAEDVPVPPNYSQADMVPAVWKHRGKLDVPKERFISYPGASPEGDSTMLLGWAGWNDLDKGLAIFSTFADRAEEDADTETLAGILSGLLEVLPWIKQWHNDLDPQFNLKMGDYLEAQLVEAARSLSIPVEDIPDHAPKPATRGRKKTSK